MTTFFYVCAGKIRRHGSTSSLVTSSSVLPVLPPSAVDALRKHYWQADLDATEPGPGERRRVMIDRNALNAEKPYVRLEWASPTDPDDLSYGGYSGAWQHVARPEDATHWDASLAWLERHVSRTTIFEPEKNFRLFVIP